jgi:hypothetical protein
MRYTWFAIRLFLWGRLQRLSSLLLSREETELIVGEVQRHEEGWGQSRKEGW